MKSVTKSCECPECNQISNQYHGTYIRKVQDLPILGKQVQLEITAHKCNCENDACKVATIAETYNGFLNYYSRMTERCADFISTLALETSCEGCARICKEMGIRISGDSVIRLLKCTLCQGQNGFLFQFSNASIFSRDKDGIRPSVLLETVWFWYL